MWTRFILACGGFTRWWHLGLSRHCRFAVWLMRLPLCSASPPRQSRSGRWSPFRWRRWRKPVKWVWDGWNNLRSEICCDWTRAYRAGAARICARRTKRANHFRRATSCRICARTWRAPRRLRCTAKPSARKHCGPVPPATRATTSARSVSGPPITSPTCAAILLAKENYAVRPRRPCKKCSAPAIRGDSPRKTASSGPTASTCPPLRTTPTSTYSIGSAAPPHTTAAR